MSLTQKIKNQIGIWKYQHIYNNYFFGLYFDVFQKEYRTQGLRFQIPFEMTTRSFRSRFFWDVYENKERKYLQQYLSREASVLELGACLGVVSCVTNSLLAHPERHVVLEANPKLIPWIVKNKIQNNCAFAVENTIISQREAVDFYLHPMIIAGNTQRITPEKVTIKGVGIEYLEQKYGLQFDTLMMDIEGGELEFLEQNQAFLQRAQSVFMEIHPGKNLLTPEQVSRCYQILRDLNYQRIVLDGNFEIWQKPSSYSQTYSNSL
ncbi:MAG: FkbM family methyltransferase [Microscillaceae bacterium]|nr:FkbM family methyltransferase [Microscillaceae bacterium]